MKGLSLHVNRYRLNIWDVGGQKTLRSYWRNYYEQTDALIWVVDTTDLHRLEDCRNELHNLLKEERLTGATLLIFANKQDLAGSLAATQLQKVLPSNHFDAQAFSLCQPVHQSVIHLYDEVCAVAGRAVSCHTFVLCVAF